MFQASLSATAYTEVENTSPLDICIPVFRHDPSPLIHDLSRQRDASYCTIRIYDDGSADPELTKRIAAALDRFPGTAVLTTVVENRGRAAARNALIDGASADWLLFLDGDMRIRGNDFLAKYRAAAKSRLEPSCIVGGFDLDPVSITARTRLHAMQARRSECLSADTRNSDPGRYVFASNVFIHREILREVAFHSGFKGWGWEDVEWGLSVARRYGVQHIDNPATHLGLDTDAALLCKYEQSGPNFLLMLEAHPESVHRMPMYRASRAVSRMPCLKALKWTTRWAVLRNYPALPWKVRLFALKLFRVSIYAQALNERSR